MWVCLKMEHARHAPQHGSVNWESEDYSVGLGVPRPILRQTPVIVCFLHTIISVSVV